MKKASLSPLCNHLVELFKDSLKDSHHSLHALFTPKLITATEQAFEEEKGDFVSNILRQLELDGVDYNALMNVNLFFEATAPHITEGDQQWLLVTLPFLASSSYGLPHGALPNKVLEVLLKHFKNILPDNFTVSINRDILNTDYFALTPTQLHQRVKSWVLNSEPGVCTFCPSFEEADEVNNLVADIRVIAILLGAPKNQSFSAINIDDCRMNQFKKELAEDLYRELRSSFLATKIELLVEHSPNMKQYLKNVMIFGEKYLEVVIAPPAISLLEAGKLFRHFSFNEALKNLLQTFNLKLEDLSFTIGNFYESPVMGCLALTELRIGIGLIKDKKNILQGISWPLFTDNPQDSLATVLNVLRHANVSPENVFLLDESNFMVEDEDEELTFPGPDGELHEPQPPEDQQSPLNYSLN